MNKDHFLTSYFQHSSMTPPDPNPEFQTPAGKSERSEGVSTSPSLSDYEQVCRLFAQAAEKVKSFPKTPGVYLMKDKSDCVIYVGKAKDLRHRAASYFTRRGFEDSRTFPILCEVVDIDFLPATDEIDALLMEARLIKDIRPKFNRDLKDDKSFPYLQVTVREEYPRVEITRTPRSGGIKLFGPFRSAVDLRGAIVALQKIFRFRNCTLRIRDKESQWNWFRPCLLASIGQCSAPCNKRISRSDYRKSIRRLIEFLEGNRKKLFRKLKREMMQCAEERRYEDATFLRNQIQSLETLNERGDIKAHPQPEVFYIDPRRGVAGLQKVFKLSSPPRVIEGIDIAHIGGTDTVASIVQFFDGLPFKPGYRRYKIRTVAGVDDYASIAEVVARRFAVESPDHPPPDILLIDGGKGQLRAACDALRDAPVKPRLIIALAKKDELIFMPDEEEPIKLSRHSFALRLLQYVRDESHRFARHYHHLLRKKTTLGE